MAQVAVANGVPWLNLRGISDTADDDAGLDLTQVFDRVEDGQSIAGWLRRRRRLVAYVVRHPDAPGKLRQLARGVRLAADRAATLVEATLCAL